MNEYLLTLRLIHIVAGVFWSGAAFMLALYLLPAINASGAEGTKVMRQLIATNRYPTVMNIASSLTILTGILLFWELSGGMQLNWISSPHGFTLTIGGIAAVIAFLLGFFINRPGGLRMTQIGQEIAKEGGKPSDNHLKEINSIKEKIKLSTNWIALLLLICVATMAVAKYL